MTFFADVKIVFFLSHSRLNCSATIIGFGYVISKIQFVLESKTTRELVQICSMHGCYLVTLKLIIIFGKVSNFITLFIVLTPFPNVCARAFVCVCARLCVPINFNSFFSCWMFWLMAFEKWASILLLFDLKSLMKVAEI